MKPKKLVRAKEAASKSKPKKKEKQRETEKGKKERMRETSIERKSIDYVRWQGTIVNTTQRDDI